MIHPGPVAPAGRPHPDRPRPGPSAELLPAVLEALPVGIALFELGEDDDITFACGNREFSRVLRLEGAPRPGRSVGEMFAGEEHGAVLELFARVRRGRDPHDHVSVQRGGKRPASQGWNVDAYPVFSAGRLTHIMVLAEQTEQKSPASQRQQVEAERLRQKADQLEELEKAKSEFLRLASHELRGPAAMLGGYLSLMEDESLGPVPKRMRPVLPLLRAKAAQINLLANEMVEAARLDDQRLQLKRRRLDLREVVRRSLQAAGTTATPEHRLRLEDRVHHKLLVWADPMRLDIIIGNLIDNAIKYSPHGGDVTVQLSIAGGLALLSVRDLGIGIAPADMDRLFVRFSRVAQETEVPGTGLGLYLARELARLHGGDIVAVSKPGEGSEFTLSLPLESGQE
jgi:signal transduction histidine kinase